MVGWAARTRHAGISGWAGRHGELAVSEGAVRLVACVLCHKSGGELRRAFKGPDKRMRYVHKACFVMRMKDIQKEGEDGCETSAP